MYSNSSRQQLFKVGSLLAVLMILSLVFVGFLSKESSLFNSYRNLYTEVSDAKMLKDGASVMLKGIKIGRIGQLTFLAYDRIRVTLQIDETYLAWIKDDAHIEINTQGVLGDKYLEITGGSESSIGIKAEKTLPTIETGFIGKIVNNGEDIVNLSKELLTKMNSVLAVVESEKLLLRDSLHSLNKSLLSAEGLITQLDGKKLNQSLSHFGQTMKNLDSITKRIIEGPGSAHSLIYDSKLHDDLKALTGGAQRSQVIKYIIKDTIENNKP